MTQSEWLFATVSPGRPLMCTLVPRIVLVDPQNPQTDPVFHTFYYGISRWSEQWRDADPPFRFRREVPVIPNDPQHRIATLQMCIAGTVLAYRQAADFLAAQPDTTERMIYQGLGHGAGATAQTVATADMGCQLGPFGAHEFRVSENTFKVYKIIKASKDFNVKIPATDDPDGPFLTPKEKAQHLLVFDGLCRIRQAIQGKAQRLGIVTCRIASKLEFFKCLAWTLGHPRAGESTDTNIILGGYERPVVVTQPNIAARFRLGIEDMPNQPIAYDPLLCETEYAKTRWFARNPVSLEVPSVDPVVAELEDCPSLSSLIPPAVLLT